jgi:hypothetical protein
MARDSSLGGVGPIVCRRIGLPVSLPHPITWKAVKAASNATIIAGNGFTPVVKGTIP